MDIADIFLRQHHEQRQAFALMDDIDRSDDRRLADVWSRLQVLLEVHAEAEEHFFYPELLKVGQGGGTAKDAASETKDAIKDHNEIRQAIRRVACLRTGGQDWWDAVEETRRANSDHMAEEEREVLPDFRRHATLRKRHDLGEHFLGFSSEHAQGIDAEDHDPTEYIRHRA